MVRVVFAACLVLTAAALPAIAQMPTEIPGKADPKRVTAGTYTADPSHTQAAFTVNHLGLAAYHGLFGDISGTLELDPAKPAASKLSIDIPMTGLVTTSTALNEHLMKPEFFDSAQFPIAHFEAKSITVKGLTAVITGNFTLKGKTKPVVLNAHFTGAGQVPMKGTQAIGFEATTSINRSDFGVSYGVPFVSDKVDLAITATFEK